MKKKLQIEKNVHGALPLLDAMNKKNVSHDRQFNWRRKTFLLHLNKMIDCVYCKSPVSLLRRQFSMPLTVTVLLVLLAHSRITAQTNIAPYATVTTSYISDWETLSAVNDGFDPANSADHDSHGAYGNWPSSNTERWVQYEWAVPCILSSASIYWFVDGGGILLPTNATIEYYANGAWSFTTYPVPCITDTYNDVNLGDILTNKIRVKMVNTAESTGILEFKVTGTTYAGTNDFEAPTEPGKPQIVSRDDGSITITYAASTDNDAIDKYDILLNGSSNKTTTLTTVTLENVPTDKVNYLSVKVLDKTGNYSYSEGIWVYTGLAADQFTGWIWPSYSPTINYSFKDEYPSLTEPTMDLNDCPEVTETQSSGWWTFKWGPNANSLVTSAAITPLLKRMNDDFAYFRDVMGWPPDKRAKNGYRSAIYLYGSGLSTDNATNTDLGGWQSAIDHNGGSWPMVLASYYPIYSFDPACTYTDKDAQMGAMVHEGIHSVLADMPGCKQAAWFQEGGNTWLQQEMESRKSGDYSSMGFLNGTTYLAPFMPIECYTGWLQDDSFGGPSAEGVNMTNADGKQICTWRNYLGGNQYGNAFPTFMGQALGSGSVAWVWRNCPGRVLEGIGTGIGDTQIRQLIMEYRAKQALIDMKEWSSAIKKLLDANFKLSVKAEWQPSWKSPTEWIATPYAKTSYDTDTKVLTPEYRTTPGWSGANQIPLNVSGDAIGDEVVIDFSPLGKNMTCQLCYRDKDGNAYYGKPVSSGSCGIVLEKLPANNIVMAVVVNTDYIYNGEKTRTAHYDYRLKLVKGILRKASIYQKWYDYAANIADVIDEPLPTNYQMVSNSVANVNPTVIDNATFSINISGMYDSKKLLWVVDMMGKEVYKAGFTGSEFNLQTSTITAKGVYILYLEEDGKVSSFKLIKK